jgi:hypothetical protein
MSWKGPDYARRHFIGGSDARIIMGDDEAALIRLWREKRGEIEPEELSGNLLVQLGPLATALAKAQIELANPEKSLVGVIEPQRGEGSAPAISVCAASMRSPRCRRPRSIRRPAWLI